MPVNHAQKELLEELYGYDAQKNPSEPAGSELATLLENKVISTQHLHWYINKAVTENCETFLASLDRLYAHYSKQEPGKITALMSLMDGLKRLNNVCFDNGMKYEIPVATGYGQTAMANYGVQSTLERLFGALDHGSKSTLLAEDKKWFQEQTRAYVKLAIDHMDLRGKQPLRVDTHFEITPVRKGRERVDFLSIADQQAIDPLPAPEPPMQPLPMHYTNYAQNNGAFIGGVYRERDGSLVYGYMNEHPQPPSTVAERAAYAQGHLLAFRARADLGRDLISVSPSTPGASITPMAYYLQTCSLEEQKTLAEALKLFLGDLVVWENAGDRKHYFPIEPKLLIVEKDPQGNITLKRGSFVRTKKFYERSAQFTMTDDFWFHELVSAPETSRGETGRMSSAFTLVASLLLCCFSEEEISDAVTKHLAGKDLNTFNLMTSPFIPSTTMFDMVWAKQRAGQLDEGLAKIMEAVLTTSPQAREYNIAQLLRPASPRPSVHG